MRPSCSKCVLRQVNNFQVFLYMWKNLSSVNVTHINLVWSGNQDSLPKWSWPLHLCQQCQWDHLRTLLLWWGSPWSSPHLPSLQSRNMFLQRWSVYTKRHAPGWYEGCTGCVPTWWDEPVSLSWQQQGEIPIWLSDLLSGLPAKAGKFKCINCGSWGWSLLHSLAVQM